VGSTSLVTTILHRHSGCGSAVHVGHKASFNVSSGIGKFASVNVSASKCTNQTSGATYEGEIGLAGLNFTVPSNGSYTFTATWVLKERVSLFVNRSGTAVHQSHTLYAEVAIWFMTEVVDPSTGRVLGTRTPGPFYIVLSRGGSLNATVPTSPTNATFTYGPLTAGVAYEFRAFAVYLLEAHIKLAAHTGNSAWASISGYGGGNRLVRIQAA
jgi:hypothetical protein